MMRACLSLLVTVFVTIAGAQSISFQPPPKSGNPKLSSRLQGAADMSSIRGKVVATGSGPLLLEDGRVVVVLVPEPGKPSSTIHSESIVELGGEILTESRFLIKAALPLSAIEQAAEIEGVRYLREPIRPQSMAITTEGSAKIGASLSHPQEVRGQGVKVAVIDVGFENAFQAYSDGELPNVSYQDFSGRGFFLSGSGEHGTACAEIVHDVAPEAELILLRAESLVDLVSAIVWSVDNDVDVISHSLGWVTEGIGDGNGPAAYLADYAAANGILFVDAAGNKTAGQIYNGLWADTDSDGWHDFASGVEVIELDQVAALDVITVSLVWDDWSKGFATESTNDYDLHLVRADAFGNWSIVASSDDWQPTIPAPREEITYITPSAGNYGIAVLKWGSAAPKAFRLTSRGGHKFSSYSSSSSTIVPPSDAAGAVSVGAISQLDWSSGQIEPFSARGPTFDGRTKPDLTAPDAVSTKSYGIGGFTGTSAAAPHVAGAAALIKSVNLGYSRDQLADALFSAAVDLGAAGKDDTYGYGKLVLPQPATQLVITQAPATSLSGSQLSTVQITARNDANQTDANFNETLILTLASGNGTLSGTASGAATNGVASFSGVLYTASQDGESYTLSVDDDSGIGSNLSSIQSSAISADVVATQLVFTQQPATSVSGQTLGTQPTVQAQDAAGILDVDFSETISLTESAAGVLSNQTQVASSGIAAFASVAFTATSDGESFTIQADDQTNVGTDLPAVAAAAITSDVVATQLVFSQAPAGSVSGQPLATQPVIQAQDADGTIDSDFSETVTLTESSPGALSGSTRAAMTGVASFSGVIYSASIDGESFTLTADDASGTGSDLPAVTSSSIASDVIATRLVFSGQPPAAATIATGFSGGVIVQAQNAEGVLDADVAETVTLSTVLGNDHGTLAAGTLASSDVGGLSKTLASGAVSWNSLIHDQSETIAIRASSQSFPTGSGQEGYSRTVNVGSFDQDGTLIAASDVSEPVDLPSTALSAGAAVPVLDFTIADGGTADSQPLAITGITLRASGSAPFSKVSLSLSGPDVSDALGVYDESSSTVTFSQLPLSIGDGASENYTISAFYTDNSGLEENQTFILSIDGDADLAVNSMGTQMSPSNASITNATGSVVTVQAVQLAIYQAPADTRAYDGTDEVVSGLAFGTQPIVSAQDAAGNTDTDFTDVVSVTLSSGQGALAGTQTASASAGAATFTELTYLAATDGETFTLSFDDETAGSGGDLPPVTSASLSADVVATRLVVTRLPADERVFDSSDEVVNGVVFATQPTVTAQDALGRVDDDVTDVLTVVLASGAGNLLGSQSVTAASGAGTFVDLAYSAAADGAEFILRFDDEATGSGGDLAAISTPELSADVVATQLVISQSPTDGRVVDSLDEMVSGLAFDTQPTVSAQDAAGRNDTDFTDLIALTLTAGPGVLSGTQSVSAVSGTATFVDLSYNAQADGETMAIRFDDEPSGSGGDLGVVSTQGLSVDVVATQLVFQSQPAPLEVPINESFAVNGIAVSTVNAEGLLDSDYASAISLLAVTTGTTDSPTGVSLTLTPASTLTPSAGAVTWTYAALDQGAVIDLLAVSGGLVQARSQAVSVIVPQNNAAPVVALTIAPQSLIIGRDVFSRRLLDQAPIFTDADGDALQLSVTVADPTVATAVLSADELLVTPQSRGLTTVTLTADDGKGGTASSAFVVMATPGLSIPHLASNALPAIDGDLSDWEAQFTQPHLIQEQFISIAGETLGPLTSNDQKVEVWFGWNASTNLIYVAGRVTDNALALPSDSATPAEAGHGDDMEIFLDVDQSGGVYDTGNAHAQRFILNASGSPGLVVFPHAITGPPLASAAVQRNGTVYSFEWALPGWDDLAANGVGTRHTLLPGTSLSIGVGFADFETQQAADAGDHHAYNALLGQDLLSGNADDFWSCQLAASVAIVSATTNSGDDVNVRLEGTGEIPAATVTLVFNSVAGDGTTVLTTGTVGPPPPPDFDVPDDVLYYDLETTATFTGSIDLCFDYGGTPLGALDRLALLHFDQFGWIDITTSVDYTNKKICGATSSFSTFTVLQAVLQTPVLIAFNGATSPTFTPTLDWNDVAGAASYVLEHASNNTFANATTVGGLAISQYSFPSPLADGTYSWRVRAIGSGGQQGPLSSSDSFVIIPTLSEWALIFLACFMAAYATWRRYSATGAR
jgi:hypothetical protein